MPARASSERWPRGRAGARHARSGSRSRCRCGTTALQRRDQALHPFVLRLERVLAEDGALCLIVQLQVHPVDGVVALALLGLADELTAQSRPRGLRWLELTGSGAVDLLVGDDAVDHAARLHPVEEAPLAVDVVV